ncbi:MAG: hypothetical protein Q4B72_04720 [Lachnospiraceae bacterium]|nr:hypothetical protein [Lachnospiraceae bacterium]
MAQKEYVVAGYLFTNEVEAKQANVELQKIHFFDTKMDYTNSENTLLLYKKILEEHLFRTPIGMDYLRRIRQLIIDRGMPEAEVPPIPVDTFTRMRNRTDINGTMKKRVELTQTDNVQKAFRFSLMINVALIAMVIALFVIALTSNNPNILNYKRNLVNQYAAWEQELTQREEALREAQLQYHMENGD